LLAARWSLPWCGGFYTTISAADGKLRPVQCRGRQRRRYRLHQGLNIPDRRQRVTCHCRYDHDDQDSRCQRCGQRNNQRQHSVRRWGTAQATDVTLIDRETREVYRACAYTPMRTTTTDERSAQWRFRNHRSMLNDGNVIDPDEAVTQGDPLVTGH